MGLTLAGCEPDLVKIGTSYGLHMGIAFQIMDDLLDVVGDAALLGKNTGMDGDKLTWVALRGVDGARKDLADQIDRAVSSLDGAPWNTEFLINAARENLNRVN